MTKRLLLMFVILLALPSSGLGVRPRPATWQFTETKLQRDARMKWWREARFGMFIHWGLYAVPAGEYKGQRSTRIGEWIMEWANIPRAEYEQFAARFNPVKFNAVEWVGLAKAAGMKFSDSTASVIVLETDK